MQIRNERLKDVEAIRLVTEAAFKGVQYSDENEGRIVDSLRSSGALTLSIVAVGGQDLLGHCAFSPVLINGVGGGWFGLGPVSVRPDHQGKGIGAAVVREGLRQLREVAEGCVVFGNPDYYGRFGFGSDPGLVYADAPPGYFQRLVFRGAAPTGEVTYDRSFNVV